MSELSSLRQVPRTGVIYVTVEAQKRGFSLDAPGWCNLGQGQPDTGVLPGAPDRVTNIQVQPAVALRWRLERRDESFNSEIAAAADLSSVNSTIPHLWQMQKLLHAHNLRSLE